jgi:hypothetical protein
VSLLKGFSSRSFSEIESQREIFEKLPAIESQGEEFRVGEFPALKVIGPPKWILNRLEERTLSRLCVFESDTKKNRFHPRQEINPIGEFLVEFRLIFFCRIF